MRYFLSFLFMFFIFYLAPTTADADFSPIGPDQFIDGEYSVIGVYKNGVTTVEFGSGAQTAGASNQAGAFVDAESLSNVWAFYRNVGSYNGRILDLKIEATGYDKFYGFTSKRPLLGGRAIAFSKVAIGAYQSGYNYVNFKMTYYYQGESKPADMKGSFMTITDMDGGQSFGFPESQLYQYFRLTDLPYSQVRKTVTIPPYQFFDTNTDANIASTNRDYALTVVSNSSSLDFSFRKRWARLNGTNPTPPKSGYLNWRSGQWFQYFSYQAFKPVQTNPIKPIKRIKKTVGAPDSEDVLANETAFPAKPFEYVFYVTVPYEESSFYYRSFSFFDVIHPSLKVDMKNIRIEDIQKGIGQSDYRSRFDFSIDDDNKLSFSAKDASLHDGNFYGMTYRVRVPVLLDKEHDLTKYTKTDTYTIENFVNLSIRYSIGVTKSKKSNTVDTKVTLPKTKLAMQEMQIYTDKITKTVNEGVGADFDDGQDLKTYVTIQASNMYWMYSPDKATVQLRMKGKTADSDILGTKTFKIGDMLISEGKLKGKKLSTAKPSDDGNPYKVEIRLPVDLQKEKLIAKSVGDDDGRSYEARFNDDHPKLNKYHHEVDDKRSLINTCGYTSSNKSLTETGGSFMQDSCEETTPKDVVTTSTLPDGKSLITYKRPIRTTRAYSGNTLGKVVKDTEMITARFTPYHKVKSGYAYDMDFTVTYKNNFDTGFTESKLPGTHTKEELDDDARYCGVPVKGRDADKCEILFARTLDGYNTYNNVLMDETHGAYKDDRSGTKVPASTTSSTKSYHEYTDVKDTAGLSGAKTDMISLHIFKAPLTYLEQRTDMSYNTAQKDAGVIKGKYINAGRFAYIPVWLKDKESNTFVSTPRTYYPKFNPAIVKSGTGLKEQRLGVNHIGFNIKKKLDIPANMWNYDQSTTPDDDQLLLQPANRADEIFKSF